MNIPIDVAYILETLNKEKFEAYIVGGCVRDILLGDTPKDWDITTSAEPLYVKKLFNRTFDTGIQHGTITVVINKENYEVTTYRIDGEYEDCRHPKEVAFTSQLKEDLLRRDFTMNAIAYHPVEGYKDFFNGQEDIKNKVIRGVGDADKRFKEDGLRMLRGVRFSAQLGFDIENYTYEALKNNVDLIEKISEERIRIELEKLWLCKHVNKMKFLWESGLLQRIDENMYNAVVGNLELTNQLKASEKIPVFVWAIVMQNYTVNEAKKFFKKLKFDNFTGNTVCEYLKYIKQPLPNDAYEMRKIIGKSSAETILDVIKLQEIIGVSSLYSELNKLIHEIVSNAHCCKIGDLKINGDILNEMGIPKGKTMGAILNYLLDEVQKNPELNEINKLKELTRLY